MAKICGKCKLPKGVSQFHRKGKGYNSWCKSCSKEYKDNHYKINKSTYLKRLSKYKKKNQREIRLYVLHYFDQHPCVDCGNQDIEVLDFDHQDNKKYNVAVLLQSGYPLETVKKEIAKCEVRCANCHRKRTSKQYGWWRSKASSSSVLGSRPFKSETRVKIPLGPPNL
jgi:hypothetical protein